MTQVLLDLIDQPLVNNLLETADDALNAKRYSLKALYKDDLTIHLDTEVPPNELYAHYLYRSGVSAPYAEHCRNMYKSISHLNAETVIDIGGNDGTLLKAFSEASKEFSFWSGVKPKRLINVDASTNLRQVNEEKGIEYHCGFFNDEMDLPKANIIVSTNVFQHTKDIHSFMRGIVKFLDGVWILEFPYTLTTLQTLQFDQFYHEHYYYWLISPLVDLFHHYGLKIIHLQKQSIHGGSMRLWMTNKETSAPEITPVFNKYKEEERLIQFENFHANCMGHIDKSKEFITGLQGRTAFFGAAAKGAVFLNALGLTVNAMPDSFIVDDTLDKQNKFMPGTGFEIVNRQTLAKSKVDNIIILAHNFAHHISESLQKEFAGKIYTCLPTITQFQ